VIDIDYTKSAAGFALVWPVDGRTPGGSVRIDGDLRENATKPVNKSLRWNSTI
jgi:hypothetical protein